MLDVTDFGARGDGVTDDRAAIQAAIDTAAAHRKGGIFLPAGVYRTSRAEDPQARSSLELRGVADFQIVGEGAASVIKLADTTAATGDWHALALRGGSRRVHIRDLVIDGNHDGLTEPSEQSHGIEVEAGTDDLVISDCILRECFGDGVRLLGTPAANVRRARLRNCLFQRNKRSGLGVQRALEQIIVEGCIFDETLSDQSIDFEPSGTDAPADILIHGCLVRHTNASAAITISGISGAQPALRVRMADCIIVGGPVFCTDVAHLAIQDCTVVVPGGGGGNRIPIQLQRGGDGALIANNILVNELAGTEAVISLSEVNQRQVSRAAITGNLCVTRAGNGIQVLSSDDVAVTGNTIVAGDQAMSGVLVHSETSAMDGIAVRDNDISALAGGGWRTGVRVTARDANELRGLSIVGNGVRGAAEGVAFAGGGFRTTPFCALNRIDEDVPAPLVGLERLPGGSVAVGGATGPGAAAGRGRTLVGTEPPGGRVAGRVGDVYQRLGGEPGATLYVKESGDGTDDGWAAK